MLIQYCTPPSRSLLGPTQLLSRMGGIGIVLKAHKKWASSHRHRLLDTRNFGNFGISNLEDPSLELSERWWMATKDHLAASLRGILAESDIGKTKFKTNTRNKRNTTNIMKRMKRILPRNSLTVHTETVMGAAVHQLPSTTPVGCGLHLWSIDSMDIHRIHGLMFENVWNMFQVESLWKSVDVFLCHI